MTLSLQPKYPNLKERICLFGPEGAGKTRAVCSVMKACKDTFFHIIDNDDSFDRILYSEEFIEVVDRGNYAKHDVDFGNWTQQLELAIKLGEEAERGQFLVFDNTTPTWQVAIPAWYTELIWGKGYDQYLIVMRIRLEGERENARGTDKKEKRTNPTFDQFRDYGVINPEYKKLYRVFLNTNAHVIFTAHVANVRDTDDAQIRKTYGMFKPAGQGDIGKIPHTSLLLRCNPQKREWTMTSFKDRQRELVDEVEFGDFAKDYLRKIAGWKLTKVD